MTTKVFVDGQEGTTGLKIFEYLSGRRDVEVLRIEDTLRKDVEERRRLINASDVTFLCLPDVASRESVLLVDADNHSTVVIDASTAFRTHDDWAYGLPELMPAHRKAHRSAGLSRIGVPAGNDPPGGGRSRFRRFRGARLFHHRLQRWRQEDDRGL
jgi:N-acetyl-gamma-glutamyl-phosphate reductase